MNFLITLSRNTKVMVPLVIAIGLGIIGGGAFINNQQKIARQNEINQEHSNQVPQQVAQSPIDPAETEESLPETSQAPADEGATTEPGEIAVEPTVTQNPDGTVTIAAKLDTTEAGVCRTIIHDTEFTAIATNGTCEFKDLSVPVDASVLKITFTADQSGQTGSTRIE